VGTPAEDFSRFGGGERAKPRAWPGVGTGPVLKDILISPFSE
jgi:hypothetical protein